MKERHNEKEQINANGAQKEERRCDSFSERGGDREWGDFDERSTYNYTLLLN